MKQTFKKRIVKAVVLFLLASAVIHLLLILVHSVMTGNFALFNLFDILDLDLFFPEIAKGTTSFVISACLSIALLSTIFFLVPSRKKA